ncbi:MAG TPA: vitamin K epoxide reductase family protein, partial [Candidatus Methylomirabilis sp.]
MHDLRPNLRPWLWASVVLCGLGIVVSGYLASKRLTGGSLACTRWAQCDVVNSSIYSKFLGIPVSFIGLAAYLVLLVLAIAALRTDGRVQRQTLLLSLLLSIGGVGFSVYL